MSLIVFCSPLSQYMASVGMKMPPTTIANSSQTNKSPLTVAKPSLPQVSTTYILHIMELTFSL